MPDSAEASDMSRPEPHGRLEFLPAPLRASARGQEEVGFELVKRCQQGDRDAVEELSRRVMPRICALVRGMRYGHDDDWVEDTVSEACAQILRSLHTYKSDITFRGWVARVCCNVCVSELRKSGRHSRALEPLSEDFDVEDSTLLAMDAHAAQAQICQALDRIAPEYRVVLILEYLNGCPLREISQALGIPIGTVKSRRAEGIKRLFRTMPPSFREGFR